QNSTAVDTSYVAVGSYCALSPGAVWTVISVPVGYLAGLLSDAVSNPASAGAVVASKTSHHAVEVSSLTVTPPVEVSKTQPACSTGVWALPVCGSTTSP